MRQMCSEARPLTQDLKQILLQTTMYKHIVHNSVMAISMQFTKVVELKHKRVCNCLSAL